MVGKDCRVPNGVQWYGCAPLNPLIFLALHISPGVQRCGCLGAPPQNPNTWHDAAAVPRLANFSRKQSATSNF